MSVMTLSNPQTQDELLNYRLMRLFAVSGAPVVRLCEGRYGISRREWRIVALLATHGPLSPSALAERGSLDRARISRAIGSLVRKRLAQRMAQPSDARRAVVNLSDSGRALYEELFPQVVDLNRELLAVLDPVLIAALDEALARLTVHAAEVNQLRMLDVRADRRRGGSRRRWANDGA